MKSLEQQLTEMDAEVRELRKAAGKSGRSTSVTQLISDSGLPPAAQARLRKRIPLNENADVVKAAITEEREYIRLAVTAAAGDRLIESSFDSTRLVESYIALGLSLQESQIAAGMEVAVTNVSEARQRLANASKLLGLTDAQAAAFAEI
jgi:hypothetical protein